MQYDRPLHHGVLIRRYKRFLADVRLENGRTVTVHCPNSGRMTACSQPGRPVVVSDSRDPRRKLRYTWELIRMGRTWVGVHSALSNRVVGRFIERGRIPELRGYDEIRREVKYGAGGRSRVDLQLVGVAQPCFVEVKHSTMRVGRWAAFPDAVSERARKHLEDLTAVATAGARAVIFFAIGRNDVQRFRPAAEIDPDYARALRIAVDAGVEALAYRFKFSPGGIALNRRVDVEL